MAGRRRGGESDGSVQCFGTNSRPSQWSWLQPFVTAVAERETNNAPRGQTTASSWTRPGVLEEPEAQELPVGPRCPGAGWPMRESTLLADLASEVLDSSTARFLAKKRKEEEEREVEAKKRAKEVAYSMLEQGRRRKRKKRKRRLLRVSSSVSGCCLWSAWCVVRQGIHVHASALEVFGIPVFLVPTTPELQYVPHSGGVISGVSDAVFAVKNQGQRGSRSAFSVSVAVEIAVGAVFGWMPRESRCVFFCLFFAFQVVSIGVSCVVLSDVKDQG